MKKLMGVMLGLSLLLGTATLFAQADKPADDKKTTKSKKKGGGKKKKESTEKAEKKS